MAKGCSLLYKDIFLAFLVTITVLIVVLLKLYVFLKNYVAGQMWRMHSVPTVRQRWARPGLHSETFVLKTK